MPRLKSRQQFTPMGGFVFKQPELNWSAPPYASFNTVVDLLIAARLANPYLCKKHGWRTDHAGVADEVDAFNAQICVTNGWMNFVAGAQGGASAPFPPQFPRQPGILQRASAVVSGSKILVEWLASGAEAVPQELAEKRAVVCAACPANGRGGMESFFTVPVQAAIQEALNQRRDWNLQTKEDAALGVCQVCTCPLPLAVHCPLELKLKGMSQEVKDNLPENCWMKTESK